MLGKYRTVKHVIFAFSLCLGSLQSNASVNISELAQDLSQSKVEDTSFTMVIWMPTVYWEAVSQNFSAISEADIDQMILVMEPFEIFAVVNGEFDLKNSGAFKSDSYDLVAEKTHLLINSDQSLRALRHSELSEMLRRVLEIMRPMLTQMMGELGGAMHLVAFAADAPDKEIDIDPASNGLIQLNVSQKQFSWGSRWEVYCRHAMTQ